MSDKLESTIKFSKDIRNDYERNKRNENITDIFEAAARFLDDEILDVISDLEDAETEMHELETEVEDLNKRIDELESES